MRKRKPSLSALEAKLDRIFSEYIRRKDADEGGTVKCVTCPKLAFWKEVDCGHWIKRQHRSVRWDERNVAPQCRRCNHFMGGVQDEFARHIMEQHGPIVFHELLALKHQVRKYTRTDLEDLIAVYKFRMEQLNGKNA